MASGSSHVTWQDVFGDDFDPAFDLPSVRPLAAAAPKETISEILTRMEHDVEQLQRLVVECTSILERMEL